MTELIDIIMQFLNVIPTNAAMLLIVGIIAWLVKHQSRVNMHTNERFDKGVTNFELIAKSFEDVKEAFKRNDDQFTILHEQIKSVHKMVLKNTIYNDSMDFFERQEAYDEYVRLGGNGLTQRYYETVLKPKIEEHIKQGNVK